MIEVRKGRKRKQFTPDFMILKNLRADKICRSKEVKALAVNQSRKKMGKNADLIFGL